MLLGKTKETILFEHKFWLQILGDHARFILQSLSAKETGEVRQAQFFIDIFDRLLMEARRELSDNYIAALNQQAYGYTLQFRNFKLHLLHRHLTGQIAINLSPTFINHMINELDEYLRILFFFLRDQMPPRQHPLHHHLLWLSDAYGHADTISSTMDMTEGFIREKSMRFTHVFEHFYLKAVEFAGYLRTHLSHFPALSRFHKEAELEIKMFQAFLTELESLRLSKEALGILAPLMADHMFREECYYLTKLSETTEINPPACDPAKPRQE